MRTKGIINGFTQQELQQLDAIANDLELTREGAIAVLFNAYQSRIPDIENVGPEKSRKVNERAAEVFHLDFSQPEKSRKVTNGAK